jgi:hypothetical protein
MGEQPLLPCRPAGTAARLRQQGVPRRQVRQGLLRRLRRLTADDPSRGTTAASVQLPAGSCGAAIHAASPARPPCEREPAFTRTSFTHPPRDASTSTLVHAEVSASSGRIFMHELGYSPTLSRPHRRSLRDLPHRYGRKSDRRFRAGIELTPLSQSSAQIIQFGASSRCGVGAARGARCDLRRKPAMCHFGNAVPMRAVNRGANMMTPS